MSEALRISQGGVFDIGPLFDVIDDPSTSENDRSIAKAQLEGILLEVAAQINERERDPLPASMNRSEAEKRFHWRTIIERIPEVWAEKQLQGDFYTRLTAYQHSRSAPSHCYH